jgi:deazaflavin-dependent oxidoreductase (nitroreductase family)
LIDGVYYVIGSRGGQEKDPQWVGNLRQVSEARVTIDRRNYPVSVHVLSDDDPVRQKVWDHAIRLSPILVDYQALTARLFPIIGLRKLEKAA